MEDVKVDKFGNVMVYQNGKWVRNTLATNSIKIALRRGKVKDLLGTTSNGTKITQKLVNQVNQKLMVADKGRGVTSSLKQETGPKGKPLYKERPVRTEPKAPPKDATTRAKEAAATKEAAKEARRLKTPEFEISKRVVDGKTKVTVMHNGKEDVALKNAMWRIVQNPERLKGKDAIKVGDKTVPVSVLREFWRAMPKEVSKAIVNRPAKGGGLRGGGIGIGGIGMEQIK